MDPHAHPRFSGYLVALAASAITLYLTVASPLTSGAPFILLAAAVMISCWYGGLGPGMVASVITALGSLYWIVPPPDSFAVQRPEDALRWGAFLFTAFLILVITEERERARNSTLIQVRRQAALAELGQRALAGVDLATLLDDTVRLLTKAMKTTHAHVLELIPDHSALVLRSGWSWQKGLVGKASVPAGTGSQAGYTLVSEKPVLVKDMRTETRFTPAPLIVEHGIVSGVTVVIGPLTRPFGVLGAFSTKPRAMAEEDAHFVQSMANVLAEAIERQRVELEVRESEERLRTSFEIMLDAFAILCAQRDRSGRIVDFVYQYVNEAACKANSLPRSAMIGKGLLEILPAHKESGLFDEYCRVVETGEPLVKRSHFYEDVYSGKRLERAYDISAAKLGDGFVVAWRDVTERERAEERTRELSRTVLFVQEKERRTISRELNEDLAQVLAAAKLHLESIQVEMPEEPKLVRQTTTEVIAQIGESLKQIQVLTRDLRPPSLDTAGLDVTLRGLCRSFETRTGLPVDYTSTSPDEIPDAAGILLYRFLQEAFSNITEHSKATHVRVHLSKSQDTTGLEVMDNGQGFDPHSAPSRNGNGNGLGLLRMREWLTLLGGSLQIDSGEGKGTRVLAQVPASEATPQAKSDSQAAHTPLHN